MTQQPAFPAPGRFCAGRGGGHASARSGRPGRHAGAGAARRAPCCGRSRIGERRPRCRAWRRAWPDAGVNQIGGLWIGSCRNKSSRPRPSFPRLECGLATTLQTRERAVASLFFGPRHPPASVGGQVPAQLRRAAPRRPMARSATPRPPQGVSTCPLLPCRIMIDAFRRGLA